MTTYIATIQEGNRAEGLQEELTRGLKAIAEQSLGDRPAKTEVKWKVISKGFGWTAGKPSNSSVVLCTVPDDLPYETRVKFMSQVNRMWLDETGADPNELLIVTHGTAL